eukprot:m.79129 g.79129  ORF g.79129 m.79129 type:complete len:459 (-) comp19264_c0_seq1:166-1542(-)
MAVDLGVSTRRRPSAFTHEVEEAEEYEATLSESLTELTPHLNAHRVSVHDLLIAVPAGCPLPSNCEVVALRSGGGSGMTLDAHGTGTSDDPAADMSLTSAAPLSPSTSFALEGDADHEALTPHLNAEGLSMNDLLVAVPAGTAIPLNCEVVALRKGSVVAEDQLLSAIPESDSQEATVTKTRPPGPPESPAAEGDGLIQSSAQSPPPAPEADTAAISALELQVAQELKARMDVYQGLIVLSALLVSASIFLFVQARQSQATAHYNGVAIFNLLTTSMVLAANVYGTSIILLQKHKAGVRISMKRYRGAIQGWQRVRVQRENAVMGITFSLPGMLCSGAFFMIGGEEVKPGNWAAFGVLLYCSLHVTYAVLAMESNFTRAEVVDEDVRAMLAWTKEHRPRPAPAPRATTPWSFVPTIHLPRFSGNSNRESQTKSEALPKLTKPKVRSGRAKTKSKVSSV